MEPWVQTIITILGAVIASSGFWAFLQSRYDKKDASKKMLIGLAHDRIIYLGMTFIERGWISKSEYENLKVYLYDPYEKMGGNGSAKHIMEIVNELPLRDDDFKTMN